jgi:hypothetical protein
MLHILYDRLEEKPSKKPVTYRIIAKKEYLKVAKKRRATKKQRRAATSEWCLDLAKTSLTLPQSFSQRQVHHLLVLVI